ncbi:hypothetical protein NECAME_05712 [Necator americanus]|uniref:Uncharacterized protein n=1 Tax=Necator americanus TaxID=51031 RepID=W2SH77_NECAM|nr:hypothetical protein NECAME_05712 [Necator americanus]ETN68231.1 hypothetical protein NECAME_05712 [Necator americanus]
MKIFFHKEQKAAKFRERNPRTIINWDRYATLAGFWEDSAMDNIDEEYDQLVEHLYDCTKKTASVEQHELQRTKNSRPSSQGFAEKR